MRSTSSCDETSCARKAGWNVPSMMEATAAGSSAE
jgi:hypothetical protein